MIDYGTEAEHLSEICDYDFENQPYEDWEKELYLNAKGRCFSHSDIGKFVVIQNSRRKKNIMPTIKFSSVDGAKFDYIHQMQNYINSKIW